MSEEENIKSEGPLLNSPQITPESSNPSQVKVEELSESDQQSSIENMEVHHHPDLHHKKKHLKEYFLEFLMIFLAVTLGFIAENIREHIGEKQKEEEYIKSNYSSMFMTLDLCISQIRSNLPYFPKLLPCILRLHCRRHNNIIPNLPINRCGYTLLIRRL